jgi:hypothetical protein
MPDALDQQAGTAHALSLLRFPGVRVAMRVFISSVIPGYESFRDAVAAAVVSLGHDVIRAEDLGASPDTPQQACLGGVREADVVVLRVGSRYGGVQPSGLSATHEEYREARESKPLLVFVERDAARVPEQETFLTGVRGWAGGQMTEDFESAEGLRDAVTKQLHRFELSQQVGTADLEEMQTNLPDGLAVFAVPEPHRRRLCTTNALARPNRELHRRTRVATLFPNEASLLRLVSAMAAEISEEWETGRIYLNPESE